MGDRISIQFSDGIEKSVVLFSHWDGKELLTAALEFVEELKRWKQTEDPRGTSPLGRYEPATVMFNFIKWLPTDSKGLTDGNYYLGVDEDDGDNSDNGHFIVELKQEGKETRLTVR